jgi:NADH:ubiquinone oxidoreductase subunit F (NADH-binding)/(2Fe-2S) ferredoxin
MTGKEPKSEMESREIHICAGTGCVLSGSLEVKKAFSEELERRNLNGQVSIKLTGCHGFCSQGPIVLIQPEGVFYPQTNLESVSRIVEEHLINGNVVTELLYAHPKTGRKLPLYAKIDFYKKQKRVILQNCGKIDPEDIDEYVQRGGYTALAKALSELGSQQVIEEIKLSGLRGRGGAGFSTGTKWQFVRDAQGEKKYVVCNADEGDPGAFMDRSVLEGDPHSVIEGMIIAAYAIGSSEGYMYVRAEYPLAVKRMRIALEQAGARGFLGENILGSGFSFDIKIKEGAGAFVCGEETALIASLEGRRGMPAIRPPFPSQAGLWGKPTCVNNVETLASVARIISNGSKKFSSLGTEKSKGTKIFAVTGKVKNSGLVEVPMGTTLREVIFGVCGGIKGDSEFKAVQIGGPSGGCLPEEFLDTPIDYESLVATGAIMGSGGMVVMDENTCMVDLAKFFLTFTQRESCGKCVPCRLGTKRMLEMLTTITKGEADEHTIDDLARLAQDVKISSLCGLGQTAPNPVLTMLKYFRPEFEAHVRDEKCQAGVCTDLLTVIINEKLCTGCGVCMRHCPVGAISGRRKEAYHVNDDKCIKCLICIEHCPFDAIYKA